MIEKLLDRIRQVKGGPVGVALGAGAAFFAGVEAIRQASGIEGNAQVFAILALLTVIVVLAVFIAVSRVPQEDNIPRSFDQNNSPGFHACMQKLLLEAREIVLIGTGIAVFHQPQIRNPVMERVAHESGCKLEIYLADPHSPAVEMRLIEEEIGDEKPQVGRQGLDQFLEVYFDKWKRLKRPQNVRIRLFSHYPSFALFIVDHLYFFYPYGYARLGNYSPVLTFSRRNPGDQGVISFLDKQYHRVRKDSVDALTAIDARAGAVLDRESLHAFALYFIPAPESVLYRFGSQVIGYDVRERNWSEPKLAKEVGDAHTYGFHITICDALYFLQATELQIVQKEIEYVAQQFSPFSLTNLRLEGAVPNQTSVALAFDDPTGRLEALHNEFVHRIYRRAAASNYSLQAVDADRDANETRSQFMTRRYKAPYIMKKYKPHLTLLTNCSPSQMGNVVEYLSNEYAAVVSSSEIWVGSLAIMTKPQGTKRWIIADEIALRQ